MDFFFIQMSDPQFGMFAKFSGMSESRVLELRRTMGFKVRRMPKTTGFADETALYEKAIAAANRLNPAFVVVSGDMVQDKDDASQLAELRRITGQLSSHIPVYWAAGNWDVGNTPTRLTLDRYRERFGDDNYSFEYGGSSFIVMNSCVAYDDSKAPQEWERQADFLRASLGEAQTKGSNHIIVFLHHPLYAEHPEEEDSWAVLPREKRKVLLDMFETHGVSAVFAGHWHRCHYLNHKGIQMVTTGAVGYPLGDDPSGFRIVKVFPDRIEHQYYGLDDLPESIK
jgi:3',5'-cyclic AMP phosphodiesterase CpdA